jgi:hypothetical protein
MIVDRRRPRHLAKFEAISAKNLALLIEALKQTGDLSVARRYAGLTNDDLKTALARNPGLQAELDSARRIGDERRIDNALQLIQNAQSIAIATQDVPGMLEVAKTIAPELYVYPVEREKARAKKEGGPDSLVQVNVGLGELASRLQEAISVDCSD